MFAKLIRYYISWQISIIFKYNISSNLLSFLNSTGNYLIERESCSIHNNTVMSITLRNGVRCYDKLFKNILVTLSSILITI